MPGSSLLAGFLDSRIHELDYHSEPNRSGAERAASCRAITEYFVASFDSFFGLLSLTSPLPTLLSMTVPVLTHAMRGVMFSEGQLLTSPVRRVLVGDLRMLCSIMCLSNRNALGSFEPKMR